MIGAFGDDDLRQYARPRCALFDWLRRFRRSLYGAVASVFLADILDYGQFGWSVFIAFTALFSDGPQVLLTAMAVLLLIRQIVNDTFPAEVLWQRLPTAASLLAVCPSPSRFEVIIIVRRIRWLFRFIAGLPCLPSRRKKSQLIRREPFTLTVAL